jgi:hypothetical protein
MPKYRVRSGKTFGPGGRFPAGTVLELTEAEFRGFEDKLERVHKATLPGLVNEVLDQPIGLRNELGAEIPEDMKLLTQEEPPVSTETPEPDEEEPPATKPTKPKTQRRKSGEG